MPSVSRYSLRSLISLLISAFIFLNATTHGLSEPGRGSLEDTSVSRHLSVETPSTSDISVPASHAKRIAPRPDHHDFTANSSSPLAKRFSEADFQRYKSRGDIAYNEISRSIVRNVLYECETPVQDFPPAALANGWSRADINELTYGQVWEDVFGKLLGENKKPTAAQSFLIEVAQDKPFTNSLGQHVQDFDRRAKYKQTYIPSISAIIAQNNRSPANLVKERFIRANQPTPSGQEINSRYVPPLNRWSDVTWTLWKEKSGGAANTLRYIARDFITNPETRVVMAYIFDKVKHTDFVPFPGLEFGMDSSEGRALLGTPNGIGIARILIDRAAQLGRREPRVRIFTLDPYYVCMLWDLVPPNQPGSSGGNYRARRHHVRHH